MRKMMSFLSGAVMGALVGATIALLMAPSSGDDLQGELRQRFSQFKDELTQAASARRVELETKLAEMRKPAPSGVKEEA